MVSSVTVGGVSTSFTQDAADTVSFATPAGSGTKLVHVSAGGSPMLAGQFAYRNEVAWNDTALSGWVGYYASDWTCGASTLTQGSAGLNGDISGCRYDGTLSTYSALLSPPIPVGVNREHSVVLRYRGDFVDDGLLVIAQDDYGNQAILSPRRGFGTRIASNVCTSSGDDCTPSPINGFHGLAPSDIEQAWRTVELHIPQDVTASGSFRLVIWAATTGTVSNWAELDDVRVLRLTPNPTQGPTLNRWLQSWLAHSSFAITTDCGSRFSNPAGGMGCQVGGVSGSNGGAIVSYAGSIASGGYGYGYISFPDMPSLSKTMVARVRQRSDFTAGSAVGDGAVQYYVCCGSSCTKAYPISGAYTAPGYYSDQSGEAVWRDDYLDLSWSAGRSQCSLVPYATGTGNWYLDEVEWLTR